MDESTRKQVPHPRRLREGSPASRSPTTTTSTATTSSSPRSATSSAPASRSAATSSCSPTGWPPGWSSSAGSRSSTPPTCRTSRPTWSTASRARPGTRSGSTPCPWQSGLTGIAYNAKFTGEIASFEELVTRADLKGKISLLSEMGDTMGFVLKLVGADPDDFDDDDWDTALDKLQEIVDSGQVRQFTGNDYTRPSTTATSTPARRGPVTSSRCSTTTRTSSSSRRRGPVAVERQHAGPQQGRPQGQRREAHELLLRPGGGRRLAAWVNYICPVAGAEEAMAKIDAASSDNPLIFPTPRPGEDLGSCQHRQPRPEQYDKDFNRIIGGVIE